MKRTVVAVLMALTLSAGVARAAQPRDDYQDSMMHPLRMAAYLAHPIGFAAEWLIGRPLQFIISRPYLDRFFGYESPEEEGTFKSYVND